MESLLDWLAPDVRDREGLERTVALVRQLALAEPADVDLDMQRAEAEYAIEVRRAGLELCEQLFGLHLRSLAGGERVGGLEPWARIDGDAAALWRALLELEGRGLGLALPSLPEPEETAEMVAARVLLAAECLGLGAGRMALWRAHLECATKGPRVALPAYAHLLDVESGFGDLDFEGRVEAHVGYVRALLLCGAVTRALDWAEQFMDLAAAEPRLMRLVGWVQVAAGDLDAAREMLQPAPQASLPALVAGMGVAWEPARAVLCGSSEWPDETRETRTVGWTGADRADLGAVALVVVRADGTIPFGDFAPGLRAPESDWLERQALVMVEREAPEAGVLESGAVWVGFPDPAGDARARQCARHCLSERTRALALVPLLPPGGGRALGWMRLEFEHFLVPDRKRLERFAATWVQRLGLAQARTLLAVDQLAELFHAAMQGFALGRRRWWGLVFEAGAWRSVATDGQILEEPDVPPLPTAGLELAKESLSGRRVALDSAVRHGVVRSALAIPLSGGRFCLAVESTRRGDLGVREVDGLVMGERGDLRGLGWRLEVTAFARWSREALGQELSSDWRGLTDCIQAIDAAGDGPVLLQGPAGCGKQTLGQLRGFLDGEGTVSRLAHGLDAAGLHTVLQAPAGLLRDVEALSAELQAVLLQAIDRGQANGLVCTTRIGLDWCGLRLREALAERRIEVPGLELRRDALPGLFQVALRRAARQLGCLAPTLAPCADDAIWRQSWERGMHDLIQLARRIVPLAHGYHLSGADLMGLAHELGWPLLDKLSTRAFDVQDLLQALEGTRKKSGSLHRGRAADRMGWDPDTLAAKVTALELEPART